MTRKTMVTLELLRDAHHSDRDMSAACQRAIRGALDSVKRMRRNARNTRSLKVRETYTRLADRRIRDNRIVREMAREHGWSL